MNILLLYPEMPDTYYVMKHFNEVLGKKGTYPPLGLLTVAALLPKEWNRRLVDLNCVPLTDTDLRWADYVFLSAMNVQQDSVHQAIQRCKQVGTPIVAGGTLFTHEWERFEEHIDHFVLNEAEVTLLPFLEDLKNGSPKKIYRSDDFADVHTTPLPDLDLLDVDDYLYGIVQFSRGCPYMCDFCDVTALFGRRPRTKTPEQIIAELESILERGSPQVVLFADDNLIGNKRVLKNEMLPALIEWRKRRKPGFYFATQLTVNLADDEELMRLMIDAGFRQVFVGIETPSEASLKITHKNQNLKRDLLANIRKLHGKGFIISAGFIVGFDTDDETIFDQQISFIQESGIPLPIINLLKAPPGTDLFARLEGEGRLNGDFAFLEGQTNILPVMDERVLYHGFRKVVDYVYEPEYSLARIKTFLSQHRFPVGNLPVHQKANWKQIGVAFRILWKIGVRYSVRSQAWRLFLWTLLHHRNKMDLAVLYAIMMHQMVRTRESVFRTMWTPASVTGVNRPEQPLMQAVA